MGRRSVHPGPYATSDNLNGNRRAVQTGPGPNRTGARPSYSLPAHKNVSGHPRVGAAAYQRPIGRLGVHLASKNHRFLGYFQRLSRVRAIESSRLMERAMGIEPTSEAWEASILPLYDARLTRHHTPSMLRWYRSAISRHREIRSSGRGAPLLHLRPMALSSPSFPIPTDIRLLWIRARLSPTSRRDVADCTAASLSILDAAWTVR
jgi:hypothetical protein